MQAAPPPPPPPLPLLLPPLYREHFHPNHPHHPHHHVINQHTDAVNYFPNSTNNNQSTMGATSNSTLTTNHAHHHHNNTTHDLYSASKSDVYNTIEAVKPMSKKPPLSMRVNGGGNKFEQYTENPAMILYSNANNHAQPQNYLESYIKNRKIAAAAAALNDNNNANPDILAAQQQKSNKLFNNSVKNQQQQQKYGSTIRYGAGCASGVDNMSMMKDTTMGGNNTMDFQSASQVMPSIGYNLDNSNYMYEEQEGNFDLQSEYSFKAAVAAYPYPNYAAHHQHHQHHDNQHIGKNRLY